ncbi:MAG TPA: HAD family hydrolase, partial [Anaerolineales bacterium]|nr:HAD family hydrolase [Anaerolineales bacterium]
HTTYSVLQTTLAEFGYSQPSEALLRQALRAMYRVSQMHWRLEPDALPTLDALRSAGHHLALISNAADDEDVQRLVDKAGLRPYFSLILTSAGEGIRKPKREIFMKALEFMGLPPERAVMVGDTLEADILGAINAGMRSVWITRRVENPQAQTNAYAVRPDAVIHTLAELPPLLACWEQRHHDGQ